MSKHPEDDITVVFDHTPAGAEFKGQNIVQLDDEGNFIEAHSHGSFVEKIEGGMRLTRPDGVTVSVIDGNVTLENLIPNSVGVRDLSEIESFAVRTVDKIRIYRIDFLSGGHVEVTYSKDDQVMEFTGRNFKQTLTKDNEIIVSRLHAAGDQVY